LISPSRKVPVAIAWPAALMGAEIEERHFQQIAAVDSAISVRDISAIVRKEIEVRAKGGPRTQGEKRLIRQLDRHFNEAEVIFGYNLPPRFVTRAPHLRWVQWCGAGIDKLVDDGSLHSDVAFTNAGGVMSVSIAEFIMAQILVLTKRVREIFHRVDQHQWSKAGLGHSDLRGKTVGIIGLGHIGREVARLAKAFGTRVIAVDKVILSLYSPMPDVDQLLPLEKLPYLLQQSDYVILTVPLTPGTTRMIGEPQFKLMKPEAYLINTSRGKVVDSAALLRALKERWIAGAAIDVIDPEPLPPEHELWSLPNVVITPHCAGYSMRIIDNEVSFFCENLRRYLAGESLLNLIDKKAGY